MTLEFGDLSSVTLCSHIISPKRIFLHAAFSCFISDSNLKGFFCTLFKPSQDFYYFIFFKINSVSGTNGVYLERWDRIDYKRIRFLLADPRYPNLPSFTTCVPTFEQPANWGDFFGSRLRTYFVPLQTGNHYFFLCKGPASICNGRLLFEIWILLMRYVNTFSKGGLPYINKNCKRL